MTLKKVEKKTYLGVIFDMDGTITRTNDLIFTAFDYIAQKYLNSNLSPGQVVKLFGPPEDYAIRTIVGDARYNEALDDLYGYYKKHHNEMAGMYEGMYDILSLLHRSDIALGLFTGKGRVTTDITLKAFNIEKFFKSVITGHDVKNHKPSGEGITRALEHMGIDKNDAVMVGDSVADIKASREAGIDIASVLWDSYGHENVIKYETDYRFHTIGEFREWIMGWVNHDA